jgi:Leucine-rich repeat (LRR) protein
MSEDGDHDARLELFKDFVERYEIELDDPVDTADEMDELEELDLSDKGLTDLPVDLGSVLPPNIKTLALEKNALAALPDSIGEFHQIRELYLRENQLAALPRGISGLEELESLYLEDNKITDDGVPDTIAELCGSLAGLCFHRNLLTVR